VIITPSPPSQPPAQPPKPPSQPPQPPVQPPQPLAQPPIQPLQPVSLQPLTNERIDLGTTTEQVLEPILPRM
jgi:hypothetical protein